MSFVISVRPTVCLIALNNSVRTKLVIMKVDSRVFFRKSVEKIQVLLKYTFLIISHSILRMKKMFQIKVVQDMKTGILCSITLLWKIVPFM